MNNPGKSSHIRRALLYMPGDDAHKIRKALTLDVDCVCMDIEDGVAYSRKAAARYTITEALATMNFGRSEKLVRINPPGTDYFREDLQAVVPAGPDGVVIPKVGSAETLQQVDEIITQYEKRNGWEANRIAVLALIETAAGVVNLRKIAGAIPRLQALIFGAEDLAGDIGAVRTRPGWEIFYARSAVVTHAAAFGLQALDMVYMNLQDLDGLKQEVSEAARMAYSGKQVIHPNQVKPVQEGFTPNDEAIARALRITQAAAEHQDTGVGAFALDGEMVDGPVVRAAEWVLRRAGEAGKI